MLGVFELTVLSTVIALLLPLLLFHWLKLTLLPPLAFTLFRYYFSYFELPDIDIRQQSDILRIDLVASS